jgi:hypothetical protein
MVFLMMRLIFLRPICIKEDLVERLDVLPGVRLKICGEKIAFFVEILHKWVLAVGQTGNTA